jgi:cytochrome c biogenesis protein
LLLSLLALTSIIGTIVPQKKSPQWYVHEYGDTLGQLFTLLDIPDMYNSWWFLGLLGLLCTNLIICSFERFPGVWKQIQANGLDLSFERIERMGRKKVWLSSSSVATTASRLSDGLGSSGWKSSNREYDGKIILFAQKGAYSRTGVYIVHLSILIIFLGAIIGELYGFKGTVMIPVTEQTDKIFVSGSDETIPLGFTVRCDSFAIELYPTGMVKDYRAGVTVLESGEALVETSIEVNAPLTHKGVTFYQSTYEGYNEFIIQVTNTASDKSKTVIIPFQTQQEWQEEGLTFGVINVKAMGQSVVSMKMWFSDGKETPVTFWLKAGESTVVERGDARYLLSGNQMYATGLQVSKDPGVWVVYMGCTLMLLGLLVAFFLSHKRIWLLLQREGEETAVLFVGSTNKNRSGFEKQCDALAETLQKEEL